MKLKQKKDFRTSDVLVLLGSTASVLGLAASVASVLGASPALLISGASVVLSFLAGVFAKDIAQALRKVSGAKRVFLSYSSQYEEAVEEMAAALRIKGVKVWTAKERIKAGQSISKAVEQALDDADSFVVFIGPGITQNVLYEIGLAKAKRKRIVPILLRPSQLPSDLQGIKYIDLAKGKEQAVQEVMDATT